MDWLKKNPALAALAAVTLGVIASAVLLFGKVNSFKDSFTTPGSSGSSKIEKIDLTAMGKAAESLGTPAKWIPKAASGEPGSLFVSQKYLIVGGKLVNPLKSKIPIHPPISNSWIGQHSLDLTSGTLKTEDIDEDGFSNLDEWNGKDGISHLDDLGQPVMDANGKALPDDTTDPNDPESHPPYHTKLALKDIKRIPFRMKFMSWDEDLKSAQLNTLDAGNRTSYIAIGEMIPGPRNQPSHFKVEKYEPKIRKNANGTEDDISELTITNTEDGSSVILVMGTVTDSPESFAIFSYKWTKPNEKPTDEFAVKKNKDFPLPPEPGKVYKLIDIKQAEVQIQTPAGEKLTLRQAK